MMRYGTLQTETRRERRFQPAIVGWLFGGLMLAALSIVVLRVGELKEFASLLRSTRPEWLILAFSFQAATYPAAAAVWQRTLAAVGTRVPLRSLVPLGIAKLFTDQALPSGGISGTALLVRALTRRGVSADAATQTVLVMFASYSSAYLIVAFAALSLLWRYHRANAALVTAATLLAAVTIAVPLLVLSLRRWRRNAPPGWLHNLPGVATSFERVAAAPMAVLRDKRLLAESLLLQLGVFMLDAATLWVVFRALGAPIEFPVAFVSFVLASVVATVGLVPLGLGTFEATAVALLHTLGVGVETAFAATLVLRGLTFWLPMVPGLWFARREVGGRT